MVTADRTTTTLGPGGPRRGGKGGEPGGARPGDGGGDQSGGDDDPLLTQGARAGVAYAGHYPHDE